MSRTGSNSHFDDSKRYRVRIQSFENSVCLTNLWSINFSDPCLVGHRTTEHRSVIILEKADLMADRRRAVRDVRKTVGRKVLTRTLVSYPPGSGNSKPRIINTIICCQLSKHTYRISAWMSWKKVLRRDSVFRISRYLLSKYSSTV